MLVLLADTRKKLLWLWLGFTVVLVLLIFIQTLAGKYEDIEGQAWGWIFVQILPGLVLLATAVLLNRNASKIVMRATFWAVYFGALAYLLLVTITLLALPAATVHWSIEEYFGQSYTWLLPFQAILLCAFALLYFRKEMLFRPNAQIMQQYLEKKVEFAQRSGNETQVRVFEQLASDGGLGPALESLRNQAGPAKDDAIVLQNQYVEWLKQRDLNLLPADALQREMNRMTLAAIGLIERL